MLRDTFKVTGKIILRRYDENGILNLECEHKNLVVTTGKQLIISRLLADTTPDITLTGVSSTSNLVTITYATRSVAPYAVGSYITLSGVDPVIFNGTYKVKSSTTTTITFDYTVANLTATAPGKINSLNNGVINKMRIGESSIAANTSDTALKAGFISPNGEASLDASELKVLNEDASISYTASFGSGNGTSLTNGIAEAGLLNSSNKMLCRTVFPPVTKTAGQTLEIFWTLTIN